MVVQFELEHPHRTGHEADRSVWVLARTAPAHVARPTLQVRPRRARSGTRRELLDGRSDCIQAVDARSALTCALSGEPRGDAHRLGHRACIGAEDRYYARPECNGQLATGLDHLTTGAGQLQSGLSQLTTGAGQLASGLAGGVGPAGQLTSGLGQMKAAVITARGQIP